jgi:hypothetical protein
MSEMGFSIPVLDALYRLGWQPLRPAFSSASPFKALGPIGLPEDNTRRRGVLRLESSRPAPVGWTSSLEEVLA